MSLQTPDKIRTLQRKLYLKAKAEPDFRFYLLYDKVWREDILLHAYHLARANAGAPGVDGQSFAMIEADGQKGWLSGLREDLRAKTYKPSPVRRVMIPKPGGGERPLGIPTIRNRVVQTAVKLVIEPIFEADLDPNAYGYRPRRSAIDAIQRVEELLRSGHTDVVDADLSKYFDTIPHGQLMQSVARRIVDRNVLRLIKMWLKAPVEETDGNGKRRMSGGKHSTCGTPQGGRDIASAGEPPHEPLPEILADHRTGGPAPRPRDHLRRRLRHPQPRTCGRSAGLDADGDGRLGLTLNEAKTGIRQARTESFDFLGYTFGPHVHRKHGYRYLGKSPSKKSVARLKRKVGDLLRPGNQAPWPVVRDQLNSILDSWSRYFGHGTCVIAYRAVDNHVYERVRGFLVRRHKVSSRGTTRFPGGAVFGELGVLRLRRVHLGPPPCALR